MPPGKGQCCNAMPSVESSWNVMAHGDAREGTWRGNWRMEWVASTLHTTSEHGVSSITTADAHTSVASSRLNWRPRRFKWTRPFRPKRRNLVSVRVPSHFKRGLPHFTELSEHHLVDLQPRRLFPSPEETIIFEVFIASWVHLVTGWRWGGGCFSPCRNVLLF